MLLNYSDSGQGRSLVLLHGMAGSITYWKPLTKLVIPHFRCIALDLRGFGRSKMPRGSSYTYDSHIASIRETLKHIDSTEPFILVGHSMGALIALRLASLYPDEVSELVLCGLPYYPTKEIAKKEITKSKRLLKLTYYGPTSHALCFTWCSLLRPATKYIAPYYLPKFSREIAQDTLLHSWSSYSQSLANIIEEQTVVNDLKNLKAPATLLYGCLDNSKKYVLSESIEKYGKHITLQLVKDLSHQLPLEKPQVIANILLKSKH